MPAHRKTHYAGPPASRVVVASVTDASSDCRRVHRRAGRPELHAEPEGATVTGHLAEPVARLGHGAVVTVHTGDDKGQGRGHVARTRGLGWPR